MNLLLLNRKNQYIELKMDFVKRFVKINTWIKYVIVGFILYTLWVFGWLIYADIIFDDHTLLDTHIENRKTPTDFSVSYAASAVDSLIFFILIGGILAFMSFKRPEEEKLATKIDYIFPGAEDDSRLSDYLQKKISSLACISPKTIRNITIQDVLLDEKNEVYALKVLSKTHCVIKNIHNNHEYATDEMAFGLTLDPIQTKDGINGEVYDISITKHTEQENPSEPEHLIDGIFQLTGENLEYKKSVSLKLTPGQTASYQSSAWIWQLVNKALTFNPPRYTGSQKVEICNTTDFILELRVGIPNSADKIQTLAPSEKFHFDVNACLPGEKVIVNFTNINQEQKTNI